MLKEITPSNSMINICVYGIQAQKKTLQKYGTLAVVAAFIGTVAFTLYKEFKDRS